VVIPPAEVSPVIEEVDIGPEVRPEMVVTVSQEARTVVEDPARRAPNSVVATADEEGEEVNVAAETSRSTSATKQKKKRKKPARNHRS
jgi:hypothetical protein